MQQISQKRDADSKQKPKNIVIFWNSEQAKERKEIPGTCTKIANIATEYLQRCWEVSIIDVGTSAKVSKSFKIDNGYIMEELGYDTNHKHRYYKTITDIVPKNSNTYCLICIGHGSSDNILSHDEKFWAKTISELPINGCDVEFRPKSCKSATVTSKIYEELQKSGFIGKLTSFTTKSTPNYVIERKILDPNKHIRVCNVAVCNEYDKLNENKKKEFTLQQIQNSSHYNRGAWGAVEAFRRDHNIERHWVYMTTKPQKPADTTVNQVGNFGISKGEAQKYQFHSTTGGCTGGERVIQI